MLLWNRPTTMNRLRRKLIPRLDLLESKIAPGGLTATTTTVLQALPTKYVEIGQPLILTAVVSNTPGGVGSVHFLDGTIDLGSVIPGFNSASSGSSTGSFTTSDLAVGSHTLTAMFSGAEVPFPLSPTSSVVYTASTSGPISITVTQPRATSLAYAGQSNATVTFGNVTTLYAVIASDGGGAPRGSVTFFDGNQVLETTPLFTMDNQTYSFAPVGDLGTGSHSITVAFDGDETHRPSVSAPTIITVLPNTSTAAGQSNATPGVGETTTLYAVVARNTEGGSGPTGSIAFLDGPNVLGTASLSTTNGQTNTSLPVHNLSPGTHSITMYYSGDTTNSASAATTTITVGGVA